MSSDAEKLIAEMFLQVKRLTEEIALLRSLISGSPTHVEGWAKTQKAAAALQAEGVQDAKELQRLRLAGAFMALVAEVFSRLQFDRIREFCDRWVEERK